MSNPAPPTALRSSMDYDKLQSFSDTSRELVLPWITRTFYPPQITATAAATRGAGAPILGEVAASGRTSIFMDNDNDEVIFPVPIPDGTDTKEKIMVRVLASQSQAAGTGSYQFTGLYLPLVTGTTTQAIPSNTLDVTWANQVDLGADISQWTAWGQINASKSGVTDGTLTPGEDELLFLAKVDLTTCTDVDVLAVQFRFRAKYIQAG